jgi:hypothetical protein
LVKAAWKLENIECMQFAKQMAIAWHLQNAEFKGWHPQNMDDLASAAQSREESKIDEAARGLDKFEVVYRSSLEAIPEPAKTIILKEREPRTGPNGKLVKAYAFADGHSEILSRATAEEFLTWEQERTFHPPD